MLRSEGYRERHRTLALAALEGAATLVFAQSADEDRAQAPVWVEALRQRPECCVQVIAQREREVDVQTAHGASTIELTDVERLQGILGSANAYIDVTGLAHHVWAPLMKVALDSCSVVRLIYFEPERYREHPTPSSTNQFDLSSGFRGVEPLPGFVNLAGPSPESKTLFVPFLGFEGPRARQVAMTLDPIPPTLPVVGLPGFRIDYPQITLTANQEFLNENSASHRVRFADASSPFDAFSVLEDIRRDHPGSYIYIAPLGTKPHAVGAVWFALENPQDIELMYDHPVKTPGRTGGVGAAHIYHLKG